MYALRADMGIIRYQVVRSRTSGFFKPSLLTVRRGLGVGHGLIMAGSESKSKDSRRTPIKRKPAPIYWPVCTICVWICQ